MRELLISTHIFDKADKSDPENTFVKVNVVLNIDGKTHIMCANEPIYDADIQQATCVAISEIILNILKRGVPLYGDIKEYSVAVVHSALNKPSSHHYDIVQLGPDFTCTKGVA